MNSRGLVGGFAAAAFGAIVAVVATHGLDRAAPAPGTTGASVQAYLADHPEAISEAVDRLRRAMAPRPTDRCPWNRLIGNRYAI